MKKVGQVTDPVESGTSFHILKAEQFVEPENVRFEDVREDLTRQVREYQVQQLRDQFLRDLISRAQKEGRIRYVDPVLKARAEAGEP